jgi:hypothetical protein
MARKITFITSPLQCYITTHHSKRKIFNQEIIIDDKVVLPTILYTAYKQGEAIFTNNFFTALTQKHIGDIQSQDTLYHRLVVDNTEFFTNILKLVKLKDIFNIKYVESNNNTSINYMLYIILLFDIKNRGDENLVKLMTFGFVNHFLPTISTGQITQNKTDKLKTELRTLLRKTYHIKIEVKESFNIENNQVNFKLFAKSKEYQPLQLIKLNGKRLKPTRINAYQQIIDNLLNPNYNPPQLTTKLPKVSRV